MGSPARLVTLRVMLVMNQIAISGLMLKSIPRPCVSFQSRCNLYNCKGNLFSIGLRLFVFPGGVVTRLNCFPPPLIAFSQRYRPNLQGRAYNSAKHYVCNMWNFTQSHNPKHYKQWVIHKIFGELAD